jgi:hypothetical protein
MPGPTSELLEDISVELERTANREESLKAKAKAAQYSKQTEREIRDLERQAIAAEERLRHLDPPR